jgi:UDP-glucose 4-epimerase
MAAGLRSNDAKLFERMRMRVLVTGGGGFIGSHTVDALLAEGVAVSVLDDFSSGLRTNLPAHANLQIIEGDIRDRATVQHAMAGASHVMHLAAQVFVPASIAEPLHSASINVTGFLNVLDAARRSNVQRFVYASSAAVYGIPERLPVDETSTVMPLSPYGLEKALNDSYAALFKNLYGISTLGLRYFNVYGPKQDPRSAYSGVISKFTECARAKAPVTVFGDGKQTRDFIYVGDVARANIAALRSEANGVINVATGSSVTLLDLVGAFNDALGWSLELRFVPERAGEVRYSSVLPSRARTELGLTQCVSLTDGIARLLAG